MNIDPCYNKHVVLGEMLIKDQGVHLLIESCHESIEDHIKNNMQRQDDAGEVDNMRRMQRALRDIYNVPR